MDHVAHEPRMSGPGQEVEMGTSSRRLSQKSKTSKPSHTAGKTKGGFCVKPKDSGIAVDGNPYKGAGLKGNNAATYDRLWARYKGAKGNA